MLLAVGVEHVHLEQEPDQCRVRGDERAVEHLGARRTLRSADVHLDELLPFLVQTLPGFAHGNPDGVLYVVYVTNQPRGFHRNEVIAHTL